MKEALKFIPEVPYVPHVPHAPDLPTPLLWDLPDIRLLGVFANIRYIRIKRIFISPANHI